MIGIREYEDMRIEQQLFAGEEILNCRTYANYVCVAHFVV